MITIQGCPDWGPGHVLVSVQERVHWQCRCSQTLRQRLEEAALFLNCRPQKYHQAFLYDYISPNKSSLTEQYISHYKPPLSEKYISTNKPRISKEYISTNKPPISEDISFNTVLTEQTVEHLTPLTFDCQCSGTPYTSGDPTAPPSVLWLRDGQPIVDGKRFKVRLLFVFR